MKNTEYVWSVGQTYLASIISGPLGGCYLLGRNFAVFCMPKSARKAYSAGVLGIMILVTIPMFLPEDLLAKIPRTTIPVMYSVLIMHLAREYQGKLITQRINEGAKRYSWWWATFVSASILVIQTPFLLLYFTLLG